MKTSADEQLPRHRDDFTSTKAFEFIENIRALVSACRVKQDSLRGGLDVFHLPIPEPASLAATEKELASHDKIWGLTVAEPALYTSALL